ILRRRPVRTDRRRSFPRPGGNSGRRSRSRAQRGCAPQLAIPARPPHRFLPPDPQQVSRLMTPTPSSLGFRMPAEWEPHQATWLAWPHNEDDWPGKFEPIAWVYCEVVRKLAQVERVRILVQDENIEQDARRKLAKAEADLHAVDFIRCATDRVWTRDYCPLFLKNAQGEVAITDWRFNGWAKYDNWKNDDAVPYAIAKHLKMRRWRPKLVLEGGSVDVNGAGLLLTT